VAYSSQLDSEQRNNIYTKWRQQRNRENGKEIIIFTLRKEQEKPKHVSSLCTRKNKNSIINLIVKINSYYLKLINEF